MTRFERKLALGVGLGAAGTLGLALGVWSERGPTMLIALWTAFCG
jgi:hypothetical protein